MITCDICGKKINAEDSFFHIMLRDENMKPTHRMEICPPCKTQLQDREKKECEGLNHAQKALKIRELVTQLQEEKTTEWVKQKDAVVQAAIATARGKDAQ